MSRLIPSRSCTFWAVFAAGAIAGCLATGLLPPQLVSAVPSDLDGQKFEILKQQVQVLKQQDQKQSVLLDGLSRDESGAFVFADPTRMVELLVVCAPDAGADKASLKVCGKAIFESHDVGETVKVNDPLSSHVMEVSAPSDMPEWSALKIVGTTKVQPAGAITPIDRPLVQIEGATRIVGADLMMPAFEVLDGQVRIAASEAFPPHVAPLLVEAAESIIMPIELRKPTTGVRFKGDRIELLVFGNPEIQEVRAEWGVVPTTGRTFLSTDDIWADSIVTRLLFQGEFGGGGGGGGDQWVPPQGTD